MLEMKPLLMGKKMQENESGAFTSLPGVNPQFSPYTYVRVAVLRSALLRKTDYDKLLKMGYHEAVRYLQDSAYRKEIDSFNLSQERITIIDTALNQNLMESIAHLEALSEEDLRQVIQVYLLRYDVENCKLLLRGKMTKGSWEDVELLLYPTPTLKKESAPELWHRENLAEIVTRLLPFVNKKSLEGKGLFEIENEITKAYMEYLMIFASSLRGNAAVLADFFREEINTLNIRTIIRLTQERIPVTQKYVHAPSHDVQQVLRQKSVQDMIQALQKQKRTRLQGDEEDFLIRIELDLLQSLFQKLSTLRYQPVLSVSRIIGYLFAKDIEIRNLKTVLKGIKLNVNKQYLEQLLVMPS